MAKERRINPKTGVFEERTTTWLDNGKTEDWSDWKKQEFKEPSSGSSSSGSSSSDSDSGGYSSGGYSPSRSGFSGDGAPGWFGWLGAIAFPGWLFLNGVFTGIDGSTNQLTGFIGCIIAGYVIFRFLPGFVAFAAIIWLVSQCSSFTNQTRVAPTSSVTQVAEPSDTVALGDGGVVDEALETDWLAPAPVVSDQSIPSPFVDRESVIWTRRPNASRLSRYFPEEAMAAGVGGRAVLDCLVLEGGALDCTVSSETPMGMGFGDASLRAARQFRAAPLLEDGMQSEGSRVSIPIRWDIPGEDR